MPSLPIPMISSLILMFLLVQMWVSGRRMGPLALLLAVCAAQGVIISLARHYGVAGMRAVQAVMAAVIPPLVFVAFQVTAVRGVRARDAVHLAAPVAVGVALLVMPPILDVLIPAVFVGYGLAVVWLSLQGADAVPRMRLAAGDLPCVIWTLIGVSLIGSALSDVLIVAVQIAGVPQWQPWIISLYSSGMLLVIGRLALSGTLEASAPEETAAPSAQVSEADAALVARLDALMAAERPYLDPDLTLTRLARRLIVPVKQLSAAINKVTGENVSRYINAARIRAAQAALGQGESVTSAMLASGFNTKSNFNR
ncbi:Helix-turn-helix domain protein [Pseudooctadecabacter jejudonensis]|uniref:Helix-turn-helix domain protein n=2 Tax=Pseudooctadecabacter jejudonensis TaxID=1391910 RepID=A0A1Y5SU48_9RHOB|nr:Helix-turn-helix domain protein [Pseudooctadecabacter jejudonensis]